MERAWGKASFRGLEHSRGGSLLAGVRLLSFELWIGRFVQEELTLVHGVTGSSTQVEQTGSSSLLVWDVRSNGFPFL